eukprot:CAMPEP_0116871786 /NCGR_PEP_ID=MMETSP0463-20121206/2278_1 /TAXON_ID=181622 /ORGANISM="Strombidinopsis sp, Strain SopsisLIS2011" /LENGTH=39 /DNA_ID= /DNA_START= /DNA_END= /DNA_ORIENTATION=
MITFDHMRVKLSHLEWAYKFIQLYRELISNEEEEEEQQE